MRQDFDLRFRDGYSLVTVNVIYYLPDHRSLVNEFLWQTLDLLPQYPRVSKFLDHWRREIDAVIKEILIAHSHGIAPAKFNSVDEIFRLQ